MRQKHFIDSHKAATGLFVLLLIALYGQWDNPTAWVYLALHGAYGALWVFKSQVFPDKQWEQPASIGYGLVIWGGLSLYWLAPWLLMARGVHAPAWCLGGCVALYTLGVFLHFAADMQKHTFLRLRPGELMTDGLWSRVRNPNYLGELLIYLGFGLLAMHWAPLVIVLLFVLFVWLPNMRRKDRSLARYPEFAAYKSRTRLLIPFVF
jgi:protein-S-isoprenylcysteine O-methyltransferase Ste14